MEAYSSMLPAFVVEFLEWAPKTATANLNEFVELPMHRVLIAAFRNAIHVSTDYIAAIGAIVLVFGVSLSLINLFLTLLNTFLGCELRMLLGIGGKDRGKATFGRVRLQLGEVTALALEILVVSDVLETLTKGTDDFSWETLGKIGAVAILRTMLAYFLGKEVRELGEEVSEELKEESRGKTSKSD